MILELLKLLFGSRNDSIDESEPQIITKDDNLYTVVSRDNYLYTRDRYGELKPLVDGLGRHVRKSIR